MNRPRLVVLCLIAAFVAAFVVVAGRSRAVRAQSGAGMAPAAATPGLEKTREPDPPVAPGTGSTGTAAKRARQAAATARLSRDVRVDFDPIVGAPRFVASTRGFLAEADGGANLPVARLAQFAGDDRVVKAFLAEHAPLFAHGPEVLEGAKLVRHYETPHNGMRTFVWQQEWDGLRVFESTFQAHVTRGGALVNVASRMVPDPATAARRAEPKVDVRAAVAVAGQDVGEDLAPESVLAVDAPLGPARKQRLRSVRLLDVSAELVWLPRDETMLELCWEVVFTSKRRGEMFRTLVEAEGGAVRVRRGLTESLSDATYLVFTSDSPSPFSPGHPTPSSIQPPQVQRTIVTTPALNVTASPAGWIADGENETRGNNVDAHTDLDENNQPDLPRPQGSPARVFAPPLDLTQAPSANRDAAVVDLFYWCNRIHDRFYELGFTEAAGNFQNDNFGRGGEGGDAINADAQDGSGVNNANFSTPADGSPGRMQMFLFNGPEPDRDCAFDHEIVIHEYTHGVSNRLVGGGTGIGALNTRGMGEGWSDFYALSLLSEPGDDVHGVYAAAAYSTFQQNSLTTNYYFGIRRYPYCTNFAKNPLTFRDIDPTQAQAHAGVPLNPRYLASNDDPTVVHRQGEVWCVTLWGARAKLIERHGFPAGNDLMLQLVTDGMKLAPQNPNFLQARDAILQADLVDTGGANHRDLWAAFAARGMGVNATAPDSTTTTGVVESYEVADELSITSSGAMVAGREGGPFAPGTISYSLVNTGTAPLSWTAGESTAWLAVAPGDGTLAPGASATVVATILPAANDLFVGSYSGSVTFTNTTSGTAQLRTITLEAEPLALPIATETWESGAAGPAWSLTGTVGHRTRVVTAFKPHGGSYHLTMDSSAEVLGTRNEATWTVNLAGRKNVELRFWLKNFNDDPHGPPPIPFTTGAHFDGVAVSVNGTTWYEVQPLRTLTSGWTRYVVDLDAAIAAHGLSYNSTFRIRFNHFGAFGIPFDGFAFDDIELVEIVPNHLVVTVPAEGANENGGGVTGSVAALPVLPRERVVALTSSAPSEATVPASVIIPAGQSEVSFPITLHDDARLDGTQIAVIAATTPGHGDGAADLAVHDNETATLTLTLPPSGTEGSVVSGTVTASAPVEAEVHVTLTSLAPQEATVPATVTIPAGQASASVPVTIVDDTRIDGPLSVTITAAVTNWTAGNASITALDNETTTLALTLPTTLREGGISQSATVRISGTLTTNLVVSLSSSDTTEVTVVNPTTTIVAGQTSATFQLRPQDDSDRDGTQSSTITATASGFTSAMELANVADNDLDHFTLSAIPSPQLPNGAIPLVVTARDVNGVTINFGGPARVTATGSEGPLPVSPPLLVSWVGGRWTGTVAVGAPGTNVVLTVDDLAGHSNASNPFDLVFGGLHHFGWSAVPSPQTRHHYFPVTLTAQDAANNPVPSFQGSVAFRQLGSVTGTGTDTNASIFIAAYLAARTQIIYLPGELAGPRRLKGLVLDMTRTSTTAFNNFTVRLKHTMRASYSGPILEPTGWTEVFRGTVVPTTLGALPITFSTPFDYDGVNNLMVDFSFDNAANGLGATCSGTNRAPARVCGGFSSGGDGDPRTWSGNMPDGYVHSTVPNVRFMSEPDGTAILPAASGPFVNGVWSGELALPSIGTAVQLRADDGAGHFGDSPVFAVQEPAPPPGPTPAFAVSLPAQALENVGAVTGSATFASPVTADTIVQLASNATATATVPSSVLVPAGQAAANFTVSITDNAVLDGPRSWGIVATPPAGAPAGASLLIVDDETTTLTLAAPASAMEGAIGVMATATLGAMPAGTLTFAAISSDPTQLTVPASVTFAPGQTVALLPLTIVDDTLNDGTQSATITLNASGFASANATILALDNESSTLAIEVPTMLVEGVTDEGSVTISGPFATDLVVNLASANPAELTVPASVTIMAGATSATFAVTAVDDESPDGTQTVAITATAAGFTSVGANVAVLDNDPHHFAFAAITGPKILGAAFTTTIVAQDASGATLTNFAGTAALSATGTAGEIVVSPTTTGVFTNGMWTGDVTCLTESASVRLTGTAGGASGQSEAFDVIVLRADLAVTPLGDFLASGLMGGPFTPEVQNYTLTNVGALPLDWTATSSAEWCDVGPASGTLASGASVTVVVTVQTSANALAPGVHQATLTFTNTTNGRGNTTRAASLDITATTFEEEVGIYNGLALPAAGATPSAERVGLIRFVFNRRGNFTCKLTLGGRSRSAKGTVDQTGAAHFFPGSTGTWVFPRGTEQSPLAVALKVDVGYGTDTLTGVVRDGATHFASILADRALFTAKKNPVAPLRNVPPELLGRYTVAFAARSPAEQGMDASDFPQGAGIGTLRLAETGLAHLTGTLADGTKITAENALSKDCVLPLYHASGRGQAMAGRVSFRDVPTVSDCDGMAMLWFRPARGGQFYPAGWPAGIFTDLIGAKYVKPTTGVPLIPGLPPADADGNALLLFTEGGLTTPLAQSFGIGTDHQAEAVAPNSANVALRMKAKTGMFGGRLTHPVTGKTCEYQGVVLQKQAAGLGSFHTKTEAGGVSLAPQ